MSRAQILLPKDLLRELRALARRQRTSMTEIVRRALQEYLARTGAPERSSGGMEGITGLYSGGPDDSVRHDDLLYGD
jgi:metal-responsive CopG/Arc/MetJ family transcriptional regulator